MEKKMYISPLVEEENVKLGAALLIVVSPDVPKVHPGFPTYRRSHK